LPYIFGVCYGINGKTVTLAEAAKKKLFSTERVGWGIKDVC
jgi:hypothetical protein